MPQARIVLLVFLKLISISLTKSATTVEGFSIIEGKNGKVCVTPGCIHAASSVLKNLDQSVEPCDDFYKFACGNFIKDHVIPDDKTSISNFNLIGDRITEQLRLILEEPPEPKEPKPFILLKKFYKICMNKSAIEDDGLELMKSLLQKAGGWPVIEGKNWKEGEFDWKKTAYGFRKMGFPYNDLMSMFVDIDEKNTSRHIIEFYQAPLGLDREYLMEGIEDEVVAAYYDYLVDVAVIFGADLQTASEDMKKSVEFEMSLAKITLPREEQRNFTTLYNPMSVSELQDKYPSIPWVEFINNIVALPNVVVKPSDIVDVSIPKYIENLEKLLETTPKKVQANYLMGQIVTDAVPYLTKELRDRELEFLEVHDGTKEMKPRWKECVDWATSELDLAAGALYVRKYFNVEAKENAAKLVGNLKAAFTEMLKTIDWMDEATRNKALEKATAMEAHVGYPQELLNDSKLEEYYAKLNPTTENFLEFQLNIAKFEYDESFGKLLEVVDKDDWTEQTSVAVVNAYYDFLKNNIQLPAGILQGVFFDNERPSYMNYGGIGYVIGHEITHGFDDMGRQFDKDGTLEDWWQEKTNEAFEKKSQCIIDQYSNYTAPELDMKLNGINTQGENIADNGGVKESYLAYEAWVKTNGEEPRLPGLNYTPKQLFWISTANVWCSKERAESLRQGILTDPHAPTYFRVIGSLSNSEDFAKDFNCPVGSKMNPTQKCKVW